MENSVQLLKSQSPLAGLWWHELSRITGFKFWTVHENFSLLSWLLLKTVVVNQAILIPAVSAIVHAEDIDAVSEVHNRSISCENLRFDISLVCLPPAPWHKFVMAEQGFFSAAWGTALLRHFVLVQPN